MHRSQESWRLDPNKVEFIESLIRSGELMILEHPSSSSMNSSERSLPSRFTAQLPGPAIYCIGTAHVSTHSARNVRELIRILQPSAVMVELDATRANMLLAEERNTPVASSSDTNSGGIKPSPLLQRTSALWEEYEMTKPLTKDTIGLDLNHYLDTQSTRSPPKILIPSDDASATRQRRYMRWSDVVAAGKHKNRIAFTGAAGSYVYSVTEALLEVRAGMEFLTAFTEAQKCNAKIILGDDPVQWTVYRVLRGLWLSVEAKRLWLNRDVRRWQRKHLEYEKQVRNYLMLHPPTTSPLPDIPAPSSPTTPSKMTVNEAAQLLSLVWHHPENARSLVTPQQKREVVECFRSILEAQVTRDVQQRLDFMTHLRSQLRATDDNAWQAIREWPFPWTESVSGFSALFPPLAERGFLDLRNKNMVARLRRYPDQTVVAVVGRAHLSGMSQYWYGDEVGGNGGVIERSSFFMKSAGMSAKLDKFDAPPSKEALAKAMQPKQNPWKAIVAGGVTIGGIGWWYRRRQIRRNHDIRTVSAVPPRTLPRKIWRVAKWTIFGATTLSVIGGMVGAVYAYRQFSTRIDPFLDAWRSIPTHVDSNVG